jgi:hypothetical protein
MFSNVIDNNYNKFFAVINNEKILALEQGFSYANIIKVFNLQTFQFGSISVFRITTYFLLVKKTKDK